MQKLVRPLVAALLVLGMVQPALAATPVNGQIVAQASTGAIHGTVVDEAGAPIAAANVTVRGAHDYHGTTDSKGQYAVTGIVPGLYVIVVERPGYDTATETDFAVLGGQDQAVGVTMHAVTFTSLRTIATVRSRGYATFNTSTAAVNVVTPQQFADQGDYSVNSVLNEVPGLQISLPSGSANGAAPGAIVIPNIRGGLAYETASLIDGHPLSVGLYGDYVTSFISQYMLGGVEVIKGPGAMAPEVNGAIGGTINFRTKDPTSTYTPDYTFGVTNHGGSFFNLGVSDTIGRIGFVADVSGVNDPSAINGQKVWLNPNNSGAVSAYAPGAGYSVYQSPGLAQLPNTASFVNTYPLIACCYSVSGQYNDVSELLKLRYKFSGSTTATVTYLGNQTQADQNGNTSTLTPSLFTPNAAYTGSATLAAGSPFLMSNVYPTGELETNNEPIFEGEVRSTIGNDTVLGRFYHAGISRIINGGNANDVPTVMNATLYGTGIGPAGQPNYSYNGVTMPLYFFNMYLQDEEDRLNGYSFEWDHPIGSNNNLSFSYDSSTSSSTYFYTESDSAYNAGALAPPNNTPGSYYTSVTLPNGSSQTFGTALLRDRATIGNKWDATLSLYSNTYKSTYPYAGTTGAETYPGSTPYGGINDPSWKLETANTSHFDERLGLTYHATPDLIFRMAAGSAIAPPYLGILGIITGTQTYNQQQGIVTYKVNSGNLVPETASAIDIGADYQIKNQPIFISADAYQTNLYNHFVLSEYNIGTCASNTLNVTCTASGTNTGTPVYVSQWINLSNSRFQGLELSIKRVTETGLQFNLQGSTQHAYAYNLPHCFYGENANGTCGYYYNLAIVDGLNFSGNGIGAPTGLGYTGFQSAGSQSVPYFQGNGQIGWKWKGGLYAMFGATVFGKNNSLNEQPFTVSYATLRVPLSNNLSFQISGTNIFNTLNAYFPISGAGVPVPLAGAPTYNGVTLPAQAASYGNVLGPANYRFILTKRLP